MKQITKHPVLDKKFTKGVTFYFNGQKMFAFEGQTIAAALLANGIKHLGFSRKLRQPRGLYCARGRCTSCFVTVEELEHVLSCQTLVEDGMKVYTNNDDPDLGGKNNGV